MAPEVYTTIEGMKVKYSPMADIWSLGMSLYFIFELNVPQIYNVGSNPTRWFEALRDGQRPALQSMPPVRLIVERCWRLSPNDRPTAAELLTMVENLPSPRRPFPLCCAVENAVVEEYIPSANFEGDVRKPPKVENGVVR